MADQLQRAATGRAKCRGCDRPIAKGELRFGEALPNPYAEGEALFWFHLGCAACMRPEKFLLTLREAAEPVSDREWLERTAEQGVTHPRVCRLVRAERSPSSRARCRHCMNPIDKGAWRFGLQIFEDGRPTPIGTLHVNCAEAYFGTRDLIERLRRLSPELDEPALRAIGELLAQPALPLAADALAKTAPPLADGLAKTRGDDAPLESPGVAKRSAS